MKKPFLYGLRGKANRELNLVVVCAAIFMVVYEKIGKTGWSLQVAQQVPIGWKYFLGLVLCASVCYIAWSGDRHIAGFRRIRKAKFWYVEPNHNRHPLEIPPGHFGRRALIIGLLFAGLGFSIVTADQRVLFHALTFAWILLSFALEFYYRRKLARLEKA